MFLIAFIGDASLTISTDRHVLSDDGRTLTVTDRGFRNVFAGLTGNQLMQARLGPVTESFSLDGATAPTRALQDCAPVPAA